jgi:2-methylcitrate dehydratase PrpD
LVDTVAAIVSGADLAVGKSALKAVPVFAGHKEACVLTTSSELPAYAAAMINAMLAHADETDDSHEKSKFHPGCSIVPTVLAMAQRENRDGLDCIRALAAGYDVGARVLEAMGPMRLNRSGHSSHAFGSLFGSGTAAGVLAGFDVAASRRLLTYLGHEVSGLSCWMADHDHVQKAYVFGGMAAKNAVFATLLCQCGWTGIDDMLSGDRTLLEAFGRSDLQARSLEDPIVLGGELLASNIKKWCVGSPIQAALDSLEALLERLPEPGGIESIVVEIQANEAYVVDNRDMPNICLQHLVALYVVDRGLSFRSAHDISRVNDTHVNALRGRVKLIASESLQKAGGRQAIVTIKTKVGETLAHHTEHVRGTWGNPMSREEVSAKAHALMLPVLGKQSTETLLSGLWQVDTLDHVQLRALISSINRVAS